MSTPSERKFGFIVPPPPPHKPEHHCHCDGHDDITTADWIKYINSYMDVRSRQIYDKLKGLVGTGTSDTPTIVNNGVSNVTYSQASAMPENTYKVGDLKVTKNGTTTTSPINVPNIDVEYATTDSFNNPTDFPILTLKLGDQDVKVYGEDPNGAILDSVLLKDITTNRIYKVFMQDGELKSEVV